MALRIAYLINQYPKISHSFIRREILALEQYDFDIKRIALQGWDSELVDELDRKERENTWYVLQKGVYPLFWSFVKTMLVKPGRLFSSLFLAFRMSKRSERPIHYHMAYLAEACRILLWLKSFNAMHLHAHFGNNSAEIAMLVHALGGPSYSFTVHGQDELLFGGIAEKVRRASFVVAISSYGRSQIFRRIDHKQWSKVKVIHCGLERSFYDFVPVPFPTALRLVCVGRLSAEKGQLLLVEAAKLLASKDIQFELVLAGDGEMKSAIQELISSYGLDNYIRITGWISSSKVREEILAARGLVLSSFTEGLPVVIMEAMALRRPVLSSNITGIPELVVPGETGWLFPAGSAEDLADAMEDCLSRSPENLKKMGDAGYHRVIERHSVDKEALKLANYFRDSRAQTSI